ncbi:MAG TPA: phosphatidylglycerophosphatase A [Candidatus Acidoferrum sp.]|jgi:phosphatidylglycerophosphatase A|nr:phosphatidylglycerophosphatase A [Candidatus Acidoferrum sp.]
MSQPTPNLPTTTTSNAEPKPRVSLAIATAFGLGYLPKAPGTWGSLGGIALAYFPWWLQSRIASAGTEFISSAFLSGPAVESAILFQIITTLIVAVFGIWSAHRAAMYWSTKDPQKVVVDEVSGQHLALLLGGFWPRHAVPASNAWTNLYADLPMRWTNHPLGAGMWFSLNWKYLLLGFILFRVFDIWKPFPARQAESLPGGLGIMADDWIAGIYAALGLWIARALGL